jgi:hypothetical protein
MATTAVPGADPRNLDDLSVGCWAEDAKGTSLIHVIGHEGGSVIFQLYDLEQDPPLFYQDAMLEKEFKGFFSVPPIGTSEVRWTWHDKTTFDWNRVMKRLSMKTPNYADVEDQLTITQKIAQTLGMRGRRLAQEDVTARSGERRDRVVGIMERIADAIEKVVE